MRDGGWWRQSLGSLIALAAATHKRPIHPNRMTTVPGWSGSIGLSRYAIPVRKELTGDPERDQDSGGADRGEESQRPKGGLEEVQARMI